MPLDLTPKIMPYYDIDETLPNLGTQPKYSYRALMTQTSTNPPIATILSNTIGNIVWTYLTNGQYQGALTAAFPANKTAAWTGQRDNNGQTLLFRTGTGTIALQTSVGGSHTDGLLTETYIQIDIYN